MTATASTLLAFVLPSTVGIAAYPIQQLDRAQRAIAIAIVLAALAPIPLLVPIEQGVARGFVGIIVLYAAGKMFDVHQQRGPRPSFRTYAAFILHPFAAVLRRLGDEPKYSRRDNLLRLARGLFFGAIGSAVLLWVFDARIGAGNRFIEQTSKLFPFYIGLEGLFIALVTLVRLTGLDARDVLDQPYLAVTPADFWRRYNRVVGQFLHEDVFRRVGGLRRPVRATMFTFIVSAIIHEYLFSIAIGEIQGYQTAFFLIQGLGVAATVRVMPEGKWALLGIVLTLTFNIATSFLFFASVDRLHPWFAR